MSWIRRAVTAVCLTLALVVPVAPAAAEALCFGDARGDTVDNASDQPTDEPRADIVEYCAAYTPEAFAVSLQVVAPTDPATTPQWEDNGSAVLFFFEHDWCLQLFRLDDGALEAFTFSECTEGGPLECRVPGLFDGTRYGAIVEPACVGAPRFLRIDARMVFGGDVDDQQGSGASDFAPNSTLFSPPVSDIPRLYGPERISTALAVSASLWQPGDAGAVVLARADAFPDALAGAPLAHALDGPLLLTPGDAVPDAVLAEIDRVLDGPGDVRVLGGTAAIGEAVTVRLRAEGHSVTRHAGSTRYATSVAIADAADLDPSVILLATGNDFPEALVAGATAPSGGGTLVLTDGELLPPSVRVYLDAHPEVERVAVGAAAAAAVPAATPVTGGDIYETSVLLARGFEEPRQFAVASGEAFPDALSGGAHAATLGIPLLLSPQVGIAEPVLAYLDEWAPFEEAIVYGGPAALSETVSAQAAGFVTRP